jgi:hypothetical protein
VFALDDEWTGQRLRRRQQVGNRDLSVTLVHGDPTDPAGPLVRVETRWEGNRTIGTRHTVELPIDGVPVTFKWSGDGDNWIAFTEHEDVAITVSALAWPVERTRLVRVSVEPTGPAQTEGGTSVGA